MPVAKTQPLRIFMTRIGLVKFLRDVGRLCRPISKWTRVDFGANLLRFHLVVAVGRLCIMIVAQL